jgi:plastocyanin
MTTVVASAMLSVAMGATVAHAQGEVAGQITLLEAKSTAKHDVSRGVVYLEPANKRGAQYSRPTGEYSNASIDMRNREFVPHIQIVRAGGSVEFPNNDPFSHNVFSNTSLGAFDLGLYRRGATRAASFPHPGVYSIYCNIHSAMVAFVVAVPTKSYARVNADGSFTIANVPAGAYAMHVWHERTPEYVAPVDVPATGVKTVAVALDTRGFVATAHLNKFDQAYPPTRGDRY